MKPDDGARADNAGGKAHRSLAGLRAAFEGRELPPGPANPPPSNAAEKAPGRVIVRREKSGRGGKTVTIAEGPGLQGRKLDELAREVAQALGTGARVESGAVVVQGEQTERLIVWLGKRGFASITRGN